MAGTSSPDSSLRSTRLLTRRASAIVRVPGPDGKMSQFAHASAIELVTPDGRLSQYYLGVEYSPKDLRLGLVEASENKIGSPVDKILTYCYHYDPKLNRHSLVVARIVQLGCLLTMFGLGGYMVVMFRRDLKAKEGHAGSKLEKRDRIKGNDAFHQSSTLAVSRELAHALRALSAGGIRRLRPKRTRSISS